MIYPDQPFKLLVLTNAIANHSNLLHEYITLLELVLALVIVIRAGLLLLTRKQVSVVVNKRTLILKTLKLLDAVTLEVNDALRVEHMALSLEGLAALRRVDVLDQGREEQDHVAALVHDGCPAVGAVNLAGKVVLRRLVCRIVPAEIVVATGEVDVFLVEDGGPLERRLLLTVSSYPTSRFPSR
jgi:hypothetical protein